jgi:hypothetical protein
MMLMLCFACVDLMVCGSLSDAEDGAVSNASADRFVVRPVHWRVSAVSGAMSVKIYSSLGYCYSESKPRYDRHRIVARGNSLYITLFVAFVRKKPDTGSGCRLLGWNVHRTIRLPKPLAEVTLYDASTSPPRERTVPFEVID